MTRSVCDYTASWVANSALWHLLLPNATLFTGQSGFGVRPPGPRV